MNRSEGTSIEETRRSNSDFIFDRATRSVTDVTKKLSSALQQGRDAHAKLERVAIEEPVATAIRILRHRRRGEKSTADKLYSKLKKKERLYVNVPGNVRLADSLDMLEKECNLEKLADKLHGKIFKGQGWTMK